VEPGKAGPPVTKEASGLLNMLLPSSRRPAVKAEAIIGAKTVETAEPVERAPRSPARRTVPEQNLQIPDEMQACAANLRKISAAIKKYEKDKGKMPDWLSDLVPDYLDKDSLLCPTTGTVKTLTWPDPKLPCSYVYEFSPTRVSSGWGAVSGMVCRDWKARQVTFFGDGVPAVRCTHGSRSLNASAGGQVYWSFGTWEFVFMPDYRRGDELGTPPSPLQPQTPEVAFDGFDGKLSLKWQIRNADPSHVSLTKRPGTLTITTQSGGFYESATDFKNLFLIENPVAKGRDFQLTTCLVSFMPAAPHNQAGLLCYDDQDNYFKWVILVGTAGEREFHLARETSGRALASRAANAPELKRVWLRLTKRGNRYIYSSSPDGKSFQVYGQLAWGDGAPKFVGLVAKNGANSNAPEIDASFDYFEIRENVVVEPGRAIFRPPVKPATAQTLQDRLKRRLPGVRRLATSAFVASWSPDGNQIVYGKTPSGAGLQILTLQTGVTTDLMSFGKDPAWSPKDGGRVAFVGGGPSADDEEIWLVEATGKNARKIADGGFPTWSADGKTVFFHSRKERKIMAIEPDRADATPTAVCDTSSAYYPSVSPDGKRIASQVGTQIVVSDRDTGDAVRKRPLPGWQGLLPGWSPDSKQVGFGSYGGQNQVGLWLLEVDTGRELMVAEGPCTMPAWSKDGSKLAFDLRAPDGWEIWIVETKVVERLRSGSKAYQEQESRESPGQEGR